jgi:hypothetical protein
MIKEGREGFTFGCDPEVFIVDAEGNPVSAAGLIPGTKHEPYWIGDVAIQVDGMAAEFNIKPVTRFEEFNDRIVRALDELKSRLPEGHSLSIVPSVVFSEDVFYAAPEEAKAMGCSPDFDAWSGDLFEPPQTLDNPFMRCAGGHIHVGWADDLEIEDEQHILNCRDLSKQLDWHIGTWSVRLDRDKARRRLYGKAGAFRPKPYGVEYRTPSNFWIVNKDRRLEVWNRLQVAISQMRERFYPEEYPEYNPLVIQSINETRRNKLLEETFRRPIMSVDARH